MQFSVTFRHMDPTESLKEYAREKVNRIKKYFPDPIMAHIVFTTERGYQHQADVNIQLHNGLVIKGTEVTEDMYSSIDLVMAKIERQVRRYKEKIRHHKARADLSDIPVAYHIVSGESWDEGPEAAGAAEARATAAPEKKATIIKSTEFPARHMSVEEAVMQMDLLENNFLVFRNSQSGHVNVVYKRSDGNYGLIETGSPG